MSNHKEDQQTEIYIHSYTRQQAISDGVLIDIEKQFPNLSKQAGFKYPIALTAKAFSRYVALNPNTRLEDPKGRMWDILWMLMLKIKKRTKISKEALDSIRFSFLCTVADEKEPFSIEVDYLTEEEDEDNDYYDCASLEEILKKDNQKKQPQLCWLKAVIGPDDEGNACITIMLPWED